MEIFRELKPLTNADYCKKELETVKGCQEKLENSFAEMKTELKAVNSKKKKNNVAEEINDLEDRIMEIAQSEQQTKSRMGGVEPRGVLTVDHLNTATPLALPSSTQTTLVPPSFPRVTTPAPEICESNNSCFLF